MPSPTKAADCSITTFGGWVTEVAPSDLPVGASPDCEEVSFTPGSVYTRAAFQRVFPEPLPAGGPNNIVPTIVYGKSYKAPDGSIHNFYYDSNGNLYIQDIALGTFTNILSSTPGTFCKSITAFGREMFAISDGLHGQEVPLQWDGANLDRITQDGPGAPPKVSNLAIPPSVLRSLPFTDGDFVIIPVDGGGSIAVGCGSGAQGDAVPLPEGFAVARMLSWASPGTGETSTTQISGVHHSTVVTGACDSAFQNRSNAPITGFPINTNWAVVAWTEDANITQSTVGPISYVSLTTSFGDDLCFAGGTLATGTPTISVPAGFSATQFQYIIGPASTNPTGNGLQFVRQCNLNAGLSYTLIYDDHNGNTWSGGANVLGFFWKNTGNVYTEAVLNGLAVVVPLNEDQKMCWIQAQVQDGSNTSLPTDFFGAPFVKTACGMSTFQETHGDDITHGFRTCEMDGLNYSGTYLDGEGSIWSGGGNVVGISSIGTTLSGSLTRSSNTVTAQTLTPHGLQVGYLVQISNVPATAIGGGINKIVINNEDDPGIATITTNTAHGLTPGLIVSLSGITGAIAGTSITTIVRSGQVVTVTTSTAHGLAPGAFVTIAGVGDDSFDGSFIVAQVVNDTSFTYGEVADDATSTGGTVSLNWPVPATTTPNEYTVVSAPTTTTFQVSINYSDGEWNSGVVKFAWNGKFYVTAVLSDFIFQYQQYGPDATTGADGTVTPYGQISPGKHQLRVTYQTRQSAILKSSPWVNFVANGGQYLQVDDIPIGSANIVARIIELTGTDGAYFYYLPVPAQVNGLIVSTATQINDNTTTSIVLDVSDNSLFAGICTSIPGNNLPAQITLDGALGFNQYGSRLITYGQRNTLQSLLNMDFDGGYLPSAPTIPTGWTQLNPGGTITPGRFSGFAYSMTFNSGGGQLTQPFYRGQDGTPLATGDTRYKIRGYFSGNGGFVAQIRSLSTSFFSNALISVNGSGWQEATFDTKTPISIPSDLEFTFYSSNGSFVVDELSLIYADTPYLDTVEFGSYVNNYEGFDGLTGKFGPVEDTHKVMGNGIINGFFYILTQDPSGRLHETSDNGTTEPAGWTVNQTDADCGALSSFCITTSQADDESASGGEKWFAWASEAGPRIFGGDTPYKIGQEIQPNWFQKTSTNPQINMAAALTITALNDPVERVIYFHLPIGAATAPSQVYPMDYKELDGHYQIAMSNPIKAYGGDLITGDIVRKWTHWIRPFNGSARMYLDPDSLTTVFFGGNGVKYGNLPGTGNAYKPNISMSTDDDFGQIGSYYITASTPSRQQEIALQLNAARKLLAYLAADISAVGQITITPYANTLSNPWPYVCNRLPGTDPTFDVEWGGGNTQGQRMYFKISVAPQVGQGGLDCRFSLQKLMLWFRSHKVLVRGSGY